MAVTESDLRSAAFTGVVVYAGLGTGLLVTLIVMAPIVQSVAFDAGLPLGLTDARLLVYGYPFLATALALLGAVISGLELGRSRPVEGGLHVAHTLIVGIVGLIILLILGHVGTLIGIAMVALPTETTTISAITLALFFLLLIPVLVTGVVTSLLTSHLRDEAAIGAGMGAPRRRQDWPSGARPAAAGGGEPDWGVGSELPGAGPEEVGRQAAPGYGGPGGGPDRGAQAEALMDEEEEAEPKRLKCPSCSHIFRTSVREGEDIVCPECGYTASTTASG